MTLPTNLKPPIVRSIVAMLIMVVLYVLTVSGMMGPNPVGQSGSYENPLVVPAGYAFSIWSIIYIGILAFPVYQYLKRKTGDPLWKEVHFWYALNVIANGLWLVCASYDWLWISVVIIMFMLYSLLRINNLLGVLQDSPGGLTYWIEKAVFMIYFAWITLATALNISSALNFYGWDGWGVDAVTWSVIILTVTAGIAAWVFRIYRDPLFAGVVIWAFLALVVRHWVDYPILAYLSLAIIAVFCVLIFLFSKPGAPRKLHPIND